MIVDERIYDDLTQQAKLSPRLRMAFDLRNTPEDDSQRMLNAIEPGTEIPIHRHWNSSETVLCVRGHSQELLYDEDSNMKEVIDMVPGGVIVNELIGKRHNLRSLESGTVLLETKDGSYRPLEEDEVFSSEK